MNLKKIALGLCGLLAFNLTFASSPNKLNDNAYQFDFDSLHGDGKISLKQFAGKVILIVNTASKCGFTPQYEGLETLYKTYKDQGLVIIGVPSNDFGQQEPGTSKEIENFCHVNYGVTFLMANKVDVIGKNAHPFFVWAHKKLGFGSAPKWNFYKYIINRQGKLVTYYSSIKKPDSKDFIKTIHDALVEK